MRLECCGFAWVGEERAHRCKRTGGCGHVFDDAVLWDSHRHAGACLDPGGLGLGRTKNGVWLRVPGALEPA
ncbi:FDXHR family putative zinc-binding protein [Pseudonocardia nigra]|uniref:FDXHR family putative zinc-binding protein n=1 Tax=Pseudonocardia nigra TaxID=1921578 RepID=UPI001FECFC6B|nr:hypothetical protein [Pseudonocardia nigra]